jgi:putative transposase
LLSCGRYVERNPVAAGLCAEPRQYTWSSCRYYACGAADPLVAENPSFTELAPVAERRQQLWRAFLLGEDEREGVVRQEDWAVGDDAFRKRLRHLTGRPMPRRRGRPRKMGSGLDGLFSS